MNHPYPIQRRFSWLSFALTITAVVGCSAGLHAETLMFEGEDEGGMGRATMTISVNANQVVVELDNTSPILLENGSGPNSPAIVGFGFNFENSFTFQDVSWSLKAFDENSPEEIVIGSSDPNAVQTTSKDKWVLDDRMDGLRFDLLAETKDVKGGLYNPLSETTSRAADPNFFTRATLILNFDQTPVLSPLSISENSVVRMKNVGSGGDGSLKLHGDLQSTSGDETQSFIVPEPASLSLFGIGIVALYGYRRRNLAKSRLDKPKSE